MFHVLHLFLNLYINKQTMDRINVIIDHLIQSAKIQRNDDLEISLRTLKGAIDRNCLDDFANSCISFAEAKVVERMMNEN